MFYVLITLWLCLSILHSSNDRHKENAGSFSVQGSHFFLSFFFFLIFAPLLASVLFGKGPNDLVVLLRHMQSPGSSGAPVSLAGEELLGSQSQLWGSGEVSTL